MQIITFLSGIFILPLLYLLLAKFRNHQQWNLVLIQITLNLNILLSYLLIYSIITYMLYIQLLIYYYFLNSLIKQQLNKYKQIFYLLILILSIDFFLDEYTSKASTFNQQYIRAYTENRGWNCNSFRWTFICILILLNNVYGYCLSLAINNMLISKSTKYVQIPGIFVNIILLSHSLFSYINCKTLIQCNEYNYKVINIIGFSVNSLCFLNYSLIINRNYDNEGLTMESSIKIDGGKVEGQQNNLKNG